MHDPADDSAIVNPFHAANLGRQMWFNSSPLLFAQPKQIPAHDPDPPSQANQHRMESGLFCFSTKINEF
jgi:hypothetical protein